MASASTKATKLNKSAWIRAQPKSMNAKDVVAKAKGAGIKISTGFVYVVRSKKSKPGARRGPGRPRKNATPAMENSGVEGLLKAAAAEVGLSRAMEILGEQRNAVRKVLGE